MYTMKRFIESFERIAAEYPDRTAFDDTERSLTYGELAPEIKNEISHRGEALRAFAAKIREMGLQGNDK